VGGTSLNRNYAIESCTAHPLKNQIPKGAPRKICLTVLRVFHPPHSKARAKNAKGETGESGVKPPHSKARAAGYRRYKCGGKKKRIPHRRSRQFFVRAYRAAVRDRVRDDTREQGARRRESGGLAAVVAAGKATEKKPAGCRRYKMRRGSLRQQAGMPVPLSDALTAVGIGRIFLPSGGGLG